MSAVFSSVPTKPAKPGSSYSKPIAAMKRLAPLLLLTLLIGCHKNADIGPADLLYGRWQWVESRPADQPVVRADSTRPTVITFKPSGEYIYEFDGRQFTCCQPNRFIRKGNQLLFSSASGGYASPECALVNCAPYQPEQTINALSAQQLVLSNDRGQSIYKAIP